MITLQKSGDSAVKFVFEDSQHYLYGNGEIEVPVNSLILVEDSSEMATFKKIDGDTFISALYSEFGMTKAELESFYKENMVGGGSEGIDSGAVESIVEDYMTDPNYVANSAMTAEIYVGATGYTKWYTESDFIRLIGGTLGAQGYIVPTSDPYGYGTGDKYLYLNGVPTITDNFKEYLAVSGKSVSHLEPSGTKLVLVIKSEYASAITDSYKAYDIWYGFDEIPTKPTLFEEISGATYGTQWACQGTSFANVSGKRYLVMNPLALSETSELGLTNPLDLSGFDMYDDMNRIYLSANGTMNYANHTVIGCYMLVLMVTYNDYSEKAVLMPLSNTGSVGYWNIGDQFTNPNKRISYDLQMDKQYEADNLTDLYNKVGSAQTTANSGLSIANQALSQANANRNDIVQVDWNQNDSGSTNYDYIKNRPMWKEKSFSDDGKIYESDPIMSFQLNDYEITLDSPLAVGDEVRVKSSSRYGQQTMFTDSIKVNSGTLPQGSYYCGSYYPTSTWSSKYMWSNDLQTWYVYNQMFDYDASIVIIKAADVYHKLDSQYIGDDIQRTLSAGTNITISGNVISAVGGGSVTVDPSLDSGSTNPVANSAITNAVMVDDYYTGGTQTYTGYYPAQNTHLSYDEGLTSVTLSGTAADMESRWDAMIGVTNSSGNYYEGGVYGYNEENFLNERIAFVQVNGNYVVDAINRQVIGDKWVATFVPDEGYRITYVKKSFLSDGITQILEPIEIDNTTKVYDGGSAKDVIENVIEPQLFELGENKQDKLTPGNGISISGGVISNTSSYSAGRGIVINNGQISANMYDAILDNNATLVTSRGIYDAIGNGNRSFIDGFQYTLTQELFTSHPYNLTKFYIEWFDNTVNKTNWQINVRVWDEGNETSTYGTVTLDFTNKTHTIPSNLSMVNVNWTAGDLPYNTVCVYVGSYSSDDEMGMNQYRFTQFGQSGGWDNYLLPNSSGQVGTYSYAKFKGQNASLIEMILNGVTIGKAQALRINEITNNP